MNFISNFDQWLLRLCQNFVVSSQFLTDLTIFIAEFTIYLIPILLIVFWFMPKTLKKNIETEKIRQNLLFIVMTAVLAWQGFSQLIGTLWFRARPFDALIDAKELLFHRPTYSFPSDHATFLFTLAFGFYAFQYRKAGNWFLTGAILVSFARVATGLHWPTDIFAGALLGFITVWLVQKFQKNIERYIIKPLYLVAKKVKLA